MVQTCENKLIAQNILCLACVRNLLEWLSAVSRTHYLYLELVDAVVIQRIAQNNRPLRSQIIDLKYLVEHPLHDVGYTQEKQTSIIAIGLTVHNTPVEIREKLSVPEVHPLSSSASLMSNMVLMKATFACQLYSRLCRDVWTFWWLIQLSTKLDWKDVLSWRVCIKFSLAQIWQKAAFALVDQDLYWCHLLSKIRYAEFWAPSKANHRAHFWDQWAKRLHLWGRCKAHYDLQAEWPRAIQELCSFPHIEEAGVLSTCNRLELYVVALSWHRVRLHLDSSKYMALVLGYLLLLLLLFIFSHQDL